MPSFDPLTVFSLIKESLNSAGDKENHRRILQLERNYRKLLDANTQSLEINNSFLEDAVPALRDASVLMGLLKESLEDKDSEELDELRTKVEVQQERIDQLLKSAESHKNYREAVEFKELFGGRGKKDLTVGEFEDRWEKYKTTGQHWYQDFDLIHEKREFEERRARESDMTSGDDEPDVSS